MKFTLDDMLADAAQIRARTKDILSYQESGRDPSIIPPRVRKRRQQILGYLKANGASTVAQLVKATGRHNDTVRVDLHSMSTTTKEVRRIPSSKRGEADTWVLA